MHAENGSGHTTSEWQPAADRGGSSPDTSAVLPDELEAGGQLGAPPHSYLIAHSVSKQHNLGMIARSATAFGVHEVRRTRQAGAGAGPRPRAWGVTAPDASATELGCSSLRAHTGAARWLYALYHTGQRQRAAAASPRRAACSERAAAARQVCLVGSRSFRAFGSHGAVDHVQLRHFATLAQCCAFLREERGARPGAHAAPSLRPRRAPRVTGLRWARRRLCNSWHRDRRFRAPGAPAPLHRPDRIHARQRGRPPPGSGSRLW
jgi:hypothetical protein